MARIGIIGGSGLDDPRFFHKKEDLVMETPFGSPSSELTVGEIEGVGVIHLARHGKRHQLSPSGVNYRANIHALKEAGATHILATTACGSLRQEIGRGDLVILDQFIDFTRHRKTTFFESFES
ncbi:MAG: S-methyl-5'-thioadenosine phosphorylase, partial [Desulfobacteraceae bacterium]